MSRIVVTEFVSLDGVIGEPRWTFQFDRGPEGDKFKYDELFGSDALHRRRQGAHRRLLGDQGR